MEAISSVINRPVRPGIDLTKLGMDKYFPSECSPDCIICNGVGYVRRDAEIGSPDFGKLFPCINSHYIMGNSGLYPGELSLAWGDIKDIGNVRGAVDAVLAALDKGYGWVYLWGEYGTAKTLILKVTVAVCLKLGAAATYMRMAEALQYIREAFDNEIYPMTIASRRLEYLSEYPVLALDELDRFNLTGFAKEQTFLIMDKRYEANVIRQEGVTVIACNKPPEALDGYLADRVRDGRNIVYQLTGESVRPLME